MSGALLKIIEKSTKLQFSCSGGHHNVTISNLATLSFYLIYTGVGS